MRKKLYEWVVLGETWASVVEKVVQYWPHALSVATMLGLGTWFASAWNFVSLQGWGVYPFFGAFFAVLLCTAFYIFVVASSQRQMNSFAIARESSGKPNILSKTHENVRLSLSDFYHPFFKATEHVRLEKCELMGPAAIALIGSTLDHCTFVECEIVIVHNGAIVKGTSLFKTCSFINCTFYRVTLLMNWDHYEHFPLDVRNGLPIISGGPDQTPA